MVDPNGTEIGNKKDFTIGGFFATFGLLTDSSLNGVILRGLPIKAKYSPSQMNLKWVCKPIMPSEKL